MKKLKWNYQTRFPKARRSFRCWPSINRHEDCDGKIGGSYYFRMPKEDECKCKCHKEKKENEK